MNGENGRIFEIQPESCAPFFLKTSDGVFHDFSDSSAAKKIERDDTQIIVTVNPGQERHESKHFFPLGVEIIYGRRLFSRGMMTGHH